MAARANLGNGTWLSKYTSAKDEVERPLGWKNDESTRTIPRSVDERFEKKFQTFDGGGRGRSSASSDSEKNLRVGTYCARSDSDSESDRKKWTKNPLVVRRMKRSDKLKQAEKRLSETGSGIASKNRDSFIYHSNEEDKSGTIRPDVGNRSSKDSGSSSRGSSRYQKLEEMRRKRLNLSVTSDEETTCQSSPRPSPSTRNFPVTEIEPVPYPLSRRANFVPVTAQTIHHPLSHLHASIKNNVHPAPPRQNGDRVCAKIASSLVHTNAGLNRQPLTFQFSETSNVPSQHSQSRKTAQESYIPQSYLGEPRQLFKPQPLTSQFSGTTSVPIQAWRQAPSQHSQLSELRQPSYKTSSLQAGQAVCTTPDTTMHKLTTQVRLPSADCALDSPSYTIENTKTPCPSVAVSQNFRHIQTRESPTSKQEQLTIVNVSPSSYHGLALQSRKSRDDQLKPAYKIPNKVPSYSHLAANSDDSLDELVQSNIQYLHSQVDKTKTASRNSMQDDQKIGTDSLIHVRKNQPSIQVQTSTSIQLHVSLPPDTQRTSPAGEDHILQTASSNLNCFPRKYEKQLISQPDMVPRTSSRTALFKPAQPGIQVIVPSTRGKNLHSEAVYTTDREPRSDAEDGLRAARTESGMFSDVGYDIEVSQRVKKWETLMKVKDDQSSRTGNKNMIAIHENMEGGEIVKSGIHDRQCPVSHLPLTKPRHIGSDIQKWRDGSEQNVIPAETIRFSQVIQNLEPLSQFPGVNHTSLSLQLEPDKTFTSASQLGQHRPNVPSVKSGLVQATDKPLLSENYGRSQTDSPLVTRTTTKTEILGTDKRASKYREELEEMSVMKADSVVNLRRRFDTASTTSDDDQRSVSTASAKLMRPSKESRSHADSVDWSKLLPGYKSKIKESDLWSPNLESTRGVPVSIERVAARTLQTIPFSEDPFWKEVEQMTTFDPTGTSGDLNEGKTQKSIVSDELFRSHHHHVELNPPHSFTLPNQFRNLGISVAERNQKSKSLYTPNIIPSTRSTCRNAAITLDQVLTDINRASKSGKQLNPGEISVSSRLTHQPEATQPAPTYKDGQFKLSAGSHSIKTFGSGHLRHVQSETVAPQPTQFCQHSSAQHRQPLMSQGRMNNYQLDPNVLKQKLLSTGLVEDTDIEDTVDRGQYQGSQAAASPPDKQLTSGTTMPDKNLTHDSIAPSYTAVTLHSTSSPRWNVLSVSSWKQASKLPSTTPAADVSSSLSGTGTRPETSTLGGIQRALAPLQPTSYQPDPETLYGASRLQSFREPRFDTSRGVHTSATGWSYHTQVNKERQPISESSLSDPFSTLEQVNQRMDDLKHLARNVEERINVIKSKLGVADENSLDSILLSLRQMAPQVKSHQAEPSSLQAYYTTKKSKLSHALLELDRIYKNLQLDSPDLTNIPDTDSYKPGGSYSNVLGSQPILGSQPKSVHLRPMQTRISSMFIGGLDKSSNKSGGQDEESEFDVISKSLHAIVDEVKQTTDLLSRANERSRADNMAAETQKQKYNVTVHPGNTEIADGSFFSTTDAVSTSQTLAGDVRQMPEVKTTGFRFRPKIQESREPFNANKTTSDLESSTDYLRQTALQDVAIERLDVLAELPHTVKENPSSETPTTSSCSPATQQRARVRPVNDNKIIQEDRACKMESNQKVLRVSCSPLSSPTVSRKIKANSGPSSVVKLQSPQASEVSLGKPAATAQSQKTLKKQFQELEGKDINKSAHGSWASPEEKNMSSARNPDSSAPSQVGTSTSVRELDQALITLQLSASASLATESSSSSGFLHSSSSASTGSMNLTPPVPDSHRPCSKTDESETTSSSEHKTKRQLGTGVSMLLGKFSSGADRRNTINTRHSAGSDPELVLAVSGNDDMNTGRESVHIQATHTKDNRNKLEQQLQDQSKSSKKQHPNLSKLGTSSIVSPLERKITGPEAKTQSSGTTSPQTFTAGDKPPQSPWKRQVSDPEKQSVTEAIKAGSPKFISKLPRPVSLNGSTPSEGYFTPKEMESPREGVIPAAYQKHSCRDRPRSFHELISCFEKDPRRLQTYGTFRKCASADEVNTKRERVSM